MSAYTSLRYKQNQVPTSIIYAGVFAVIAAVSLWVWMNPTVAYDKRGCLLNTAPDAVTYVMVDRTDPLTQTQYDALHEIFSQFAQTTAAGTDVVVVPLDVGWNGLGEPLFDACRPARTKADDPASDLPEQMMARNYEQKFLAPLLATADKLETDETAGDSPIYEAVGAITRTPGWSAAHRRRLVLVTDGLENMPDFHEPANATADFKRVWTKQAWQQDRRANLSGATVDVFYLLRKNRTRIQTAKHRAFIADWIATNGGHLGQLTQMPFGQ